MLLFSCFCLLVGDMLFGYDTASFGGILANPVSDFLSLSFIDGLVIVGLTLLLGVRKTIWHVPSSYRQVCVRLPPHLTVVLSCIYWQVYRVFRRGPSHREVRPSNGIHWTVGGIVYRHY